MNISSIMEIITKAKINKLIINGDDGCGWQQSIGRITVQLVGLD